MFNIITKSFQEKIKKSDGLRVCIMRRIKKEYNFDIWIPGLAPSEKLLNQYIINKKMPWKLFKQKYTVQVLKKNRKLIKLLLILSKEKKISLLCWELSPNRCHRNLILKECLKLSRANNTC